MPKNLKLVCRILGVVLGCHYTNTPVLVKDQVTALVDGDAIQLAGSNAVLRTGDGDR